MGRKKRLSYLEVKVPFTASVKRRSVMEFDKVITDLGFTRSEVVQKLIEDFNKDYYGTD